MSLRPLIRFLFATPLKLSALRNRWLPIALSAGFLSACLVAHGFATGQPTTSLRADQDGQNPHPVRLLLPAAAPLSAVANLGKQIFFDRSLSASGSQSCASCHSPAYAYNPPNGLVVQRGGSSLTQGGYRPPPSLAYLYRQAPFSIGPDASDTDIAVNINDLAAAARHDARAQKSAGSAPTAIAMVPQGGLFWDGRADSLQRQAYMPLLNPVEMANTSVVAIARKLARSSYRGELLKLFGPGIFGDPEQLVSEAMFALGRYQIEDPSFHAFTSKYDAWLQGQARLTDAEMRGLNLFNDPQKANCGGCHLSQVSRDGLPPLFTDTQYEALGVPRNPHLPINRDPGFFDLGVCGPLRKDLAKQTQYCGMFLTPTLRNVDRRSVFFHNGVYRTLKEVLDFYNLRSVQPEKIYPRNDAGKPMLYNDIPPVYQNNVDTADAPFNRNVGDRPAMTDQDIRDIIAFLHTLDDGYIPPPRGSTSR